MRAACPSASPSLVRMLTIKHSFARHSVRFPSHGRWLNADVANIFVSIKAILARPLIVARGALATFRMCRPVPRTAKHLAVATSLTAGLSKLVIRGPTARGDC